MNTKKQIITFAQSKTSARYRSMGNIERYFGLRNVFCFLSIVFSACVHSYRQLVVRGYRFSIRMTTNTVASMANLKSPMFLVNAYYLQGHLYVKGWINIDRQRDPVSRKCLKRMVQCLCLVVHVKEPYLSTAREPGNSSNFLQTACTSMFRHIYDDLKRSWLFLYTYLFTEDLE